MAKSRKSKSKSNEVPFDLMAGLEQMVRDMRAARLANWQPVESDTDPCEVPSAS